MKNPLYSSQLLEGFDQAAGDWRPFLTEGYGADFAEAVLEAARARFESLVPKIPYIGGDENHLTDSLIGSVRYLALYQTMKARRKSAAETGKVIYEAVSVRAKEPLPPIPPEQILGPEELMQRRRERAEYSLQRRYPDDFVYDFVEGDGETFDYGYNFLECATVKFYRTQGAGEFTPYYCFLDFPKCEGAGLGLHRSMTLSEGYAICNFRFKEGGKAAQHWPPLFLGG